jgi:hypothetical protein
VLRILRTRGLIMRHMKTRLLAIVLILVFTALTYIAWHELLTTGSYSLKLAAFGPVGIVGGLFLFVFPTKGKPQTTGDKLIVMVVFVIGLLAGLANWYLMDPGFFHK